MTNADKFKNIFGLYATELWSMPEKDFLKWLNSEALNCSEIPNNSDVISRQAAVSIPELPKEYREYQTMNLDDAYELGWYDLQKCIEKMPSAQPEIIRCRDCKHYYYADNRIPQEQMCTCDLDGDRWSPNSYCSFAERKTE